MLKKYKFPLSIFLVMEKLTPNVFTSETLSKNHFIISLDKNWYFCLNAFLKNELFYSQSTLNEISIIDSLKYPEFNENNFFDLKKRLILFNVYYMYLTKIRLSVMIPIEKNINSIENLYKNANWLEREASEMFGINFLNKKDVRPLLLDYSRLEFPMLKDFPAEGYQDIFFDFFENKLMYTNHEFIEL